MKSLLDIQQEIRSLEKSVIHIAESIKGINSDIGELRNSNLNMDVDYSKIELLAKNISFRNHPIKKLDGGRVCQIYLIMLLNIVRLGLEEEVSLNRLIFIQWIKLESGIDLTLEDLHKDCYKINSDSYYEMVNFIPQSYREYFVVDALVVANLGGNTNTDIYEYIADLAAVLGIEKERLRILSLIARTVLCQNIGYMEEKDIKEFRSCVDLFDYYMADILKSNRSKRRVIVKLHDYEAKDLKWKVKQGQEVKKGDIVATYTYSRRYYYSSVQEAVEASSSGTMFHFKDNGIYYGVLSHKLDNKDSIKAWVKEKRK